MSPEELERLDALCWTMELTFAALSQPSGDLRDLLVGAASEVEWLHIDPRLRRQGSVLKKLTREELDALLAKETSK